MTSMKQQVPDTYELQETVTPWTTAQLQVRQKPRKKCTQIATPHQEGILK